MMWKKDVDRQDTDDSIIRRVRNACRIIKTRMQAHCNNV